MALSDSDSFDSFESNDADQSIHQAPETPSDMAEEAARIAAQKLLMEQSAMLAPFVPVFKADTQAKIGVKARDIDRQISNYNRRFKAWRDMIPIQDLPNKTWFGVWRTNLSNEALDVLDKLVYLPTEDSDDYLVVSKKLLEFLTEKKGSKFTSRVFFRTVRQADNENFASFLQRLKSAAAPCRWKEDVKTENMIEQIIAGHKDERVHALLFDLESDDLDKYIKKCEALEMATLQAAQVAKPSTSSGQAVDSVHYNRGAPYNRGRGMPRGPFPRGRGIFSRGGYRGGHQGHQNRCGWCGGHEHGMNNSDRLTYCKARNHTCNKCNKKGHFEQCCLNSKNAQQPP